METIKANSIQPNYNHNLVMHDRNYLEITGVKKIESFDNEEFLLETIMGYMIIKGLNLEMSKLDTEKGIVIITGEISSLEYLNSQGRQEDSIFSRLFK